MRRFLWAILALALVTSGAHAKGLVIVHETASSNPARGFKIQEGLVNDALRELGGDYDAVRSSQFAAGVTIQNLRRGRFFNGIDSVTYNPIIHVGYYVGRSSSFDSLISVINYCSVAHLFIGNMMADNGAFANATRCTVGVSGATDVSDDSSTVTYVVGNPGIRWVQENGGARCKVDSSRPTNGWRPLWGMRSSTRAKAVTTASASDWLTYDDSFDGTYPTDPDTVSFWSILNVDATGVPIQFTGQAAAVPMTFVMPTYKYATISGEMTPYVAGLLRADSLSGGALFPESKRKTAQISIHIDDGWKRGNSRVASAGYGGIDVRDTTALKASIDSLAVLGVPFVLGVEIDSLRSCWLDTTSTFAACYTVGGLSPTLHTAEARGGATAFIRKFVGVSVGMLCSMRDSLGRFTTVTSVGADSTLELSARVNVTKSTSSWAIFWDASKFGDAMLYDGRWWARAGGLIRYTPHCHAGTTTANGQIQEYQPAAGPYWRMQDIWGTNTRARSAWGGGTGLGQDSTFSFLAKRAFFLLDSTFGASRVDHVAMPPGDDWSPTYNATQGIGNWPIPMSLDSLLFAWTWAGGRGIRNNSATNTSMVSQRLGSYGIYTGTMDYTVTLPYTLSPTDTSRTYPGYVYALGLKGTRGRFVSCPSYPTTASSISYSRMTSGKGIRAFNSAFNGHIAMVPDPASTTQDQMAKAQVLAIHVSDLGTDAYGRSTRPGFYCIKYPVMASRAANAVGRWTAIRWVYPEELCP